MKYFLYRMHSDATAPNGGDFRSWLHFYKWGRPEIVTFRKRTPHFKGARKGDVMFFVLDGFLIGDALIADVRNDVYIEGSSGPVQEIDVPEGGIWEYFRGWGLWDKYRDRLRLAGLEDEAPLERAAQWLEAYRGLEEAPWATSPRGRVATYNPDDLPPFFSIKKK